MYNLYITVHGAEFFLGRYCTVLEIVMAVYALVDYDDFTFCIDPLGIYFRPRGIAIDTMYMHLSEKVLEVEMNVH